MREKRLEKVTGAENGESELRNGEIERRYGETGNYLVLPGGAANAQG